ncbi:MAG: hypothetical protein ACW98K_13900 [Candidatus Kariarchaeaceae archaeon]|jgi:hypothetical protein
MRIFSVFIMIDDGRYLYHQSFTPDAPTVSLVTGLLTAVQAFMVELTGTYPTFLAAGGFAFHLEKIGPVTVVLTSSDDRQPMQSLSQLGMRFINKFGSKVEEWKGNPSDFTEFKGDIEDILGTETVQKHIYPKDPLNSLALLALDSDLQDVAKGLLQIGQCTVSQLSETVNKSEYEVKIQLEQLLNFGHIGRIEQEDDFIYFIR